jgi:hypothetical protein
MLQFVNTNVRLGPEDLSTEITPLHNLTFQADPQHHLFHKNQVILGQQLFRHGANANLGAFSDGPTLLHIACDSGVVTNLDFI